MSDINFEPRPYAILHKQICDNYLECPAKIACEEVSKIAGHQPAIYIDKDNKIEINKDNCTGCRACLEQCGLFRIVSGVMEEIKEQKEFAQDPRNKMDFSAERFGCDIINKEDYLLKDLSEVETYINESQYDKINILEFVDEAHVLCPFMAIEVDFAKKTFPQLGEYKKFVIKSMDEATFTKIDNCFSINQFPAILFLFKGQVLGEPLTNEYRVKKDLDRKKIEKILQDDFSNRLEGK